MIEYFTYIKPLINEDECGDICLMLDSEDVFFAALIDVLGHGKEAQILALRSIEIIENNYFDDIQKIVDVLHEKINRSRGLVGSFVQINKKTAELTYLGVGNVSGILLGDNNHRFVNKEGIIGQNISRHRIEKLVLKDKDLILLYSDGIPEKINFKLNDDFETKSAKIIAREIVDNYSRGNDDSTCFVLKFSSQN
ncbi:MAG: SpoIIE family protein phosphatase [Cyclobacteriaceae bacterium]|nr:SpoIIE family protein phosphatase [Cyclobacteriaceae bacterium]